MKATRLLVAAMIGFGALALRTDAALASKTRPVNGKTSQGREIRLRTGDGRLDVLGFAVELGCRDGSVLIDQESDFEPTSVGSGGRFSERQFGGTDVVRFRGRVTGHAVSGRLRVTDVLGSGVTCNSKWVSFKAG